MSKKIIILVAVILYSFNVDAQSKYGLNEQGCKENLSMFREYYKQKNYIDAYSPWMWTFKNCPKSSQNIYKNGPKIVKAKMKSEPKENINSRNAYIDTLMMVFDQRIKHFGNEGYVLGLKGYTLLDVDKERTSEALTFLEKSLDLDGNSASVQAVYGYVKAMVNLEKLEIKTKEDVLEAYTFASEIIEYNILNETRASKNFIKYSEIIEKLFTPYANCEDLIALFSQKIDSSTLDVNLLKRVLKLLSNKKCKDDDLFFNVSSRLYELEPTASAANQMSKMSISKGKSSDAVAFAKEAIASEERAEIKAKYYLSLADAYRFKGSYASARGAVYRALELRKGWGEAYINLGNIYVAGAKSCGSDFETQTVYWVAVDAFRNALLDLETKERASKSINTYSKYFPKKEDCFFNGITAGNNHTIGCWISKSTIARTSD